MKRKRDIVVAVEIPEDIVAVEWLHTGGIEDAGNWDAVVDWTCFGDCGCDHVRGWTTWRTRAAGCLADNAKVATC